MAPAGAVAAARQQVHATCLRMVADRLVVGSAGNVSVRVDKHRAVVSAGGVAYERLAPEDHPLVDLRDGSWFGGRRPTSELALHTALLTGLPGVDAVVHTHSRHAAAFAVARRDLPFICNESLAVRADRVLVTSYAPPGTADLGAQALATFRRQPGSRAVLLANHGVVAVAGDLDDAYLVAAAVEWTAEICVLAHLLGGPHVLGPDVQDAIARTYGVPPWHGPGRSSLPGERAEA